VPSSRHRHHAASFFGKDGTYDYGTYWPLVALTVGLALTAIVTFGSMTGSMLPSFFQEVRLRSGNRHRRRSLPPSSM